MNRNKNELSLEERIARVIDECLALAEEQGCLDEDEANDIAQEWTIDDDEDAEEHPDLDALYSAVYERFGF